MAGGAAPCPAVPVARYITIGTATWNDLQPYGSEFFLAGTGSALARYTPTDGGVVNVGGGSCAGRGDYLGVSVRPGDQAVFLTTSSGLLLRWHGPALCQPLGTLPGGPATAVRAFDDFIFVASFDAPDVSTAGLVAFTRFNPDGGSPSVQTQVVGQAWQLSGPNSGNLYAAGSEHPTQFRGRVWRHQSNTWSQVVNGTGNGTSFWAIDMPTANLGFAGGPGLYEWNGMMWTPRVDPPFLINGLEVLGVNAVYAVGNQSSQARIGLWNGSTWTLLGPPTHPSGDLKRIRGASRCALLGVGTAGLAVTTFP